MGYRFAGRTRARSQALQLMFQAEASGRTVAEVLDGEYTLYNGPLREFGRELALGCDGVRHDLDAIIATRSKEWSINRMPAVDRNMLRLSLFEMIYVPEVDIPVAINEVVELAKAYGTDESAGFINGVLGRIADDIEAGVDVVAKAHEELSARGETSADVQYALEGGKNDVWEEPEEELEPVVFGADMLDELTGGIWYVEGPGTVYEDDEEDW